MILRLHRPYLSLLVAFALASCDAGGDGGGTQPPPSPTPPGICEGDDAIVAPASTDELTLPVGGRAHTVRVSDRFTGLPDSLLSRVTVSVSPGLRFVRSGAADTLRLFATAAGDHHATFTFAPSCGDTVQATLPVSAADFPTCEVLSEELVDYFPIGVGNRWEYDNGTTWEVTAIGPCEEGVRRATIATNDGTKQLQISGTQVSTSLLAGGSWDRPMTRFYPTTEPDTVRMSTDWIQGRYELIRGRGVGHFTYAVRGPGSGNYTWYPMNLIEGP